MEIGAGEFTNFGGKGGSEALGEEKSWGEVGKS
jgi:hypothetical protein